VYLKRAELILVYKRNKEIKKLLNKLKKDQCKRLRSFRGMSQRKAPLGNGLDSTRQVPITIANFNFTCSHLVISYQQLHQRAANSNILNDVWLVGDRLRGIIMGTAIKKPLKQYPRIR
jgi:hypothetical protein